MNIEVSKAEPQTRWKRIRAMILATFLLIIAIGVWYVFFRDVEAKENQLQAPVVEANGETIQRVFVFDTERSIINFEVDGVGIDGTFDMFGHWFRFIFDSDTETWIAELWLDIDGQSVETGNGLLNNAFIFAFKAEEYPVGRFVGTTVEAEVPIESLDEEINTTLIGQIELSGVIQDLSVPIRIRIEGETLSASASFPLDASDFDAGLASAAGGSVLNSDIEVVANEVDPDSIATELPDIEDILAAPAPTEAATASPREVATLAPTEELQTESNE